MTPSHRLKRSGRQMTLELDAAAEEEDPTALLEDTAWLLDPDGDHEDAPWLEELPALEETWVDEESPWEADVPLPPDAPDALLAWLVDETALLEDALLGADVEVVDDEDDDEDDDAAVQRHGE